MWAMRKHLSSVLWIILIFSAIVIISVFFHAKPKNIIFISIDNLRADRLGCMGYTKGITPNIDKFSMDAVMFKNTFTSVPVTVYSHMSIFTSLYPETYCAKDLKDLREVKNTLMLAERLKRKNYDTAAVVSSVLLDRAWGINKGFDFFMNIKENHLIAADKVNNYASQILKILSNSKEKAFLFFHYFDIHADYYPGNDIPYYSLPKYLNAFVPNDLRSKYSKLFTGKNRAIGFLQNAMNRNIPPPTKEQTEYLADLYDAGVACTDNYLGELFRMLKEHNLYDDSLIVLFSDHGEEFGEHGSFLHSQLYDECVRTMLLVKFPKNKFAGNKVGELVETIDILPTVFDYLGFAAPENIQGKSFMKLVKGGHHFKDEIYLQMFDTHAVRTKKYKFLYNTKNSKLELFDLVKDPSESVNIADTNRAVVSALKDKITLWQAECGKLAKTIKAKYSAQSAGNVPVENKP
jgi:arylsulfatase